MRCLHVLVIIFSFVLFVLFTVLVVFLIILDGFGFLVLLAVERNSFADGLLVTRFNVCFKLLVTPIWRRIQVTVLTRHADDFCKM